MDERYVFRQYVPVGARRAQAQTALQRRLRSEKRRPEPVVVDGRAIARTFWGRAWCENLERYSDFASRLPRGRTYARNGSVVDLQVLPGTVRAHVAGYDLYTVEVTVAPLAPRRWRGVVSTCGSRIGSLIGLLRGELSDDVMAVLTDRKRGLFPEPREIRMTCSCPDWATMCKHVAATLYGVGVRLDLQPELFFALRQVDQADLVGVAGTVNVIGAASANGKRTKRKHVAADRLESIFGIEIVSEDMAAQAGRAGRKRRGSRTR